MANIAFLTPTSPKLSSSGEIRALTSMRGVAAIVVALHHLGNHFGAAFNLLRLSPIVANAWTWVDFFFILSGFVLFYAYQSSFRAGLSQNGYAVFLIRRIGRVWPLHAVILALFVATELAKYVIPSNADPAFSHNTWSAVLSNLAMVQAWHLHPRMTWNEPTWSISAEFAAYLAFPVLVPPIARLRPLGIAALAAACWAALLLLKYTLGHGTLDITFDWGVLRCLPSFILGMLLARCYADRRATAAGSDRVAAAALASIFAGLQFGLSDILMVPLFCLVVLSLGYNRGHVARALTIRPLYRLGVLSYSIYLLHSFVLRIWQLAFLKLFHDRIGETGAVLVLLTLLALVIAGSALTHRLIERPGRRAFERLARTVLAHDLHPSPAPG